MVIMAVVVEIVIVIMVLLPPLMVTVIIIMVTITIMVITPIGVIKLHVLVNVKLRMLMVVNFIGVVDATTIMDDGQPLMAPTNIQTTIPLLQSTLLPDPRTTILRIQKLILVYTVIGQNRVLGVLIAQIFEFMTYSLQPLIMTTMIIHNLLISL
jgi:hypothetical protein